MNRRRAENVKNGRSHKIVLEGDLAEIIERRWVAREFTRDDNTVALSQFVFHLEGCPIGDFRKAWATACRAAGLVKPQLDKNYHAQLLGLLLLPCLWRVGAMILGR